MYSLAYRKFSFTASVNGETKTEQCDTGILMRIALTQSKERTGLASNDVLMLSEIIAAMRKAEISGSIDLENAQFDHLKSKVESAIWQIWGDDVAQFIIEVREAKKCT